MFDREALKNLGWKDDLLDAVEEVSATIPEPEVVTVSTLEQTAEPAGSDSIEIPSGPPVGVTVLRID